MLPGTGWCGAGFPPFPTACWWMTHPAAINGVSVSARWNRPGGCGGPSVLLLCDRRVQSPWCQFASGVFTGHSVLFATWIQRCLPVVPACSVASSTLLWFTGPGDFFPMCVLCVYLHVCMGSDSISPNSFGWEYKPRSSLCTHAFHRADSKDPVIHVLDGWMPATKTHPVCTIHEDGIWLPLWLGEKNGQIQKILTQKCQLQRYSW